MSVLDEFRETEQRVAARLKELEPAVAEYHELQQLADRLGIDAAASTAPATTGGSPRRRERRNSASRPRESARAGKQPPQRSRGVTPAQRGQQLLELVRNRPGSPSAMPPPNWASTPPACIALCGVWTRLARKNGRQLEPTGPAT